MLKDWGIEDQLGYFMADDEAANNEAVRALLRHLEPGLTLEQQNQRRVRYLAHILLLTAKAFVLGPNPTKFEAEHESFERQGDLEALQQLGRDIRAACGGCS